MKYLGQTSLNQDIATKKWVEDKGYLTSLDVPAWAMKSALAASDVPNLDWSKITSGKPTTTAGYGITDAITTANIGSQSVASAESANKVKVTANATADVERQIVGHDGNKGLWSTGGVTINWAKKTITATKFLGNLVGTTIEASSSIKIGSATISWDATNKCLKVDTGLYSESFIASGGTK